MGSHSRYAYYGEDDRIIHINEITSETTGQKLGPSLVCLDCKKQVQANIEKTPQSTFIRRFSHVSDDACSGSSGETILHIKAKEMIKAQQKLKVPEYLWAVLKPQRKHTSLAHMSARDFDIEFDGDLFDRDEISEYDYLIQTIQEETWLTFKNVRLEERKGSFIPDCIATTENGNELYIEICVTHPVDDEKQEWFRQQDVATIEIDISHLYAEYGQVDDDAQEKALDKVLDHAIIHQTDNKMWLYHPNTSPAYDRLVDRYVAYANRVKQTELYGDRKPRVWSPS